MGRTKLPSEIWLRVIAVDRTTGQHCTCFGPLTPGEPLSDATKRVVGAAAENVVVRGLAAICSWACPTAFSFAFTVVCACDALRQVPPEATPEVPRPALEATPSADVAAAPDAPVFAPVEDRQVGGGGGVFGTGPTPTLDLVVFVVVINERDEVVMVRESKPKVHGLWFLPAGHVEPGESLHDACTRELREEAFLLLDRTSVEVCNIAALEVAQPNQYHVHGSTSSSGSATAFARRHSVQQLPSALPLPNCDGLRQPMQLLMC